MALELKLVVRFKVKSGQCIKVKGKPTADAKRFAISLGRDELALFLHFNPQFHGETGTIVYNSMICGKWDEELREPKFPFWQGEETRIRIIFDAKEVTVKLPEQYEFKFPNRLGLEFAEYLSISGDFHVKAIKFE